MTKNNMVWFNPSVAGFLAAVLITMPLSVAATQGNALKPEASQLKPQKKGGWSINTEAPNTSPSINEASQEQAAEELVPQQAAEESQKNTESGGVALAADNAAEQVEAAQSEAEQNQELPNEQELTLNESSLDDLDNNESAPADLDTEVASASDDSEPSFEESDETATEQGDELSFEEEAVTTNEDTAAGEPAAESSGQPSGEPINVARIANRDVIAAKQLSYDLDQQFAALRRALETEFGFSEKLGEEYLGYGLLLREAGRYEEAIDAFVNALHISKVNNGIYAIEQRPALKALFDTHYALDNTEDYEDYLERILWIEEKNPEVRDQFSYQMLILVGNRYIDQFLRRPIAGQESVQTLLRAKHHLTAAVRHYGRNPVAQLLMPYGELALISFLESKLQPDIDKTASMEDPRLRHSRHLDGRQLALASYVDNAYSRGDAYLRSYLKKAQVENQQTHLVRALLSLGDFNQLFKKHTTASQFYVFAWNEAQKLPIDDELRNSFQEPVALPAFNYAYQRKTIIPKRANILVPLNLKVSSTGKVEDVVLAGEGEEIERHFSRARRAARRLIFRPQIIDGQPVATAAVPHDTRVYVRKK